VPFTAGPRGLCVSQSPAPFLRALVESQGQLTAGCGTTAVPIHRALMAEPDTPAHVMAPPYPPQSTRQSFLRQLTAPHCTACTTFTRKPLPLIIRLCYASEWPLNPSCTLLSPPEAELLPLQRRRAKKLYSL